jgi:hypothetical protein
MLKPSTFLTAWITSGAEAHGHVLPTPKAPERQEGSTHRNGTWLAPPLCPKPQVALHDRSLAQT